MNLMIKHILQTVLSIGTMCHIIIAQGLNPERGVTFHLRAVCAPYQLEIAKNGHNSCNNKVIDEMHDYAENVYLQGYNRELVEEYLKLSQTGKLCYGEGMRVHQITGSCDCMNKVCDRHDPKKVDYCNNIVLSPFTPSLNASSAYDCWGFSCLGKSSPGLISGSQRISTYPAMLAAFVAMAITGMCMPSLLGNCLRV